MSVLAIVVALPLVAASLGPQTASQSGSAPSLRNAVRPVHMALPVHVVLVNLSGALREVHVGHSQVCLPVGQRVPLTVRGGEPLTVTSATDSKVNRTILIQGADDGRTIAVR